MIDVKIPDERGKSVTVKIDGYPDSCPQCLRTGVQKTRLEEATLAKGDGSESCLWLTFQCPASACQRPFFAVYARHPTAAYQPSYALSHMTPQLHRKLTIDPVIAAISPNFYPILAQAAAADQYRLELIAGMGYRKALEFLAKDYMVSDLRNEQAKATADGDESAAAALGTKIAAILERRLMQVIEMIPHDLTKQLATRAAWLGNDESHYSRIWTKHDLGHLKQLLDIVTTFISNEAAGKTLLAEMQREG